MRLSLYLAWRFLAEGRTQSILILLGVTIGVGTFVFISALMEGLQKNILAKTLGSQAHIVIEPPEQVPRPLFESGDSELYARRVERSEPRYRSFDQWQRALVRIESTEGVIAACPKVTGSVLVSRGDQQEGAVLIGADPDRLRRIIDFPSNMVAGSYRLGSDEVLIGSELAQELGVGLGDPVRVSSEDREATLRVAGVFRLGNAAVDQGWLVASLRGAQTLLNRVGDVSSIDAQVEEPYDAEEIAQRVQSRTGIKAESWMARNEELLTALRSQDASTWMIRTFVLLAVAMGIASVLVVSVVQRSGQIGIMRAIGTSRRIVLGVFLWQGAMFGVGGAVLGSVVGTASAKLLESAALFEIVVTPELLLTALAISVAVGVVSAFIPARRASRMDPARAIRGDA